MIETVGGDSSQETLERDLETDEALGDDSLGVACEGEDVLFVVVDSESLGEVDYGAFGTPIVVLPDGFDLENDCYFSKDDLVDDLEESYDLGADPTDLFDQIEDDLERELAFEVDDDGPRGLLSFRGMTTTFACVVASLLVLVLTIGREYYSLPVAQRTLHHLHELLRPSGVVGLLLGVVGTLVMLASLTYIVRKNRVTFQRASSLRDWMRFHIVLGLVGPAMVLFHAAFVPYSALGWIAMTAMVIVVTSGALGRYVYARFPRTLGGRELEFEVIRKRLVVYRKKLLEIGVSPGALRLEDAASGKRKIPSLVGAVIGVVIGDRQSRQELERLREAVSGRGGTHHDADSILRLVKRLSKERQWLARYEHFHKLMGAWRFFHRWMAIVLGAAVVYHVMIATKFGALWILGGTH